MSKGKFGISVGLMVRLPAGMTSSVWPSPLARLTFSMPMLPAAPVAFSTTAVQRALRPSASTRASVSVGPPGGKGDTRVKRSDDRAFDVGRTRRGGQCRGQGGHRHADPADHFIGFIPSHRLQSANATCQAS
jgi:hypothetical protein